jgi:membrane protease YdiL (CAAX protease family)
MLSLKKQIGYSAILVQAVFFVLFLVFTGSFDWYFAPYLLFSLFSGIVAYKSESIIYSAIANIVFMVIVDASVIATR